MKRHTRIAVNSSPTIHSKTKNAPSHGYRASPLANIGLGVGKGESHTGGGIPPCMAVHLLVSRTSRHFTRLPTSQTALITYISQPLLHSTGIGNATSAV